MNQNPNLIARARENFPTPGHLWLFLRVAAWTIAAPHLIKALPLPTLMKLVSPNRPQAAFDEIQLTRLRLVNSYITTMLRRRADRQGKMCLPRSLVLYRFARDQGAPAVFCCGVRKEGQELRGHAWIELGGKRRHDPQEHVAYAVTFRWPAEKNQT